MLVTGLFLVVAAAPLLIEPCIAEVTVRDAPALTGTRVGVLRAGQRVEVLAMGTERQRIPLTIDKNVEHPFTVAPTDVWLQVRPSTDAGLADGWVFGGVMCPPSLAGSERSLSVLAWSAVVGPTLFARATVRFQFMEAPSVAFAGAIATDDGPLGFVRFFDTEGIAHVFVPVPLRASEAWRDTLPGVRLVMEPGVFERCAGLEATGSAAALKKLAPLKRELTRRLQRRYRNDGSSPDACLVRATTTASSDGGSALSLEWVANGCAGNECPGDACKRTTVVTVSPAFQVLSESSAAFDGYSCDP